MAAKLGARFWANLLLSFAGGTTASFAACRLIIGATENWFILTLVGLGFGIASGYGILFLFPKDGSSEGSIGRYAFWPALVPGLTIAEVAYAAYPMVITFSGILGFLIALLLHFRHDFGAKNS